MISRLLPLPLVLAICLSGQASAASCDKVKPAEIAKVLDTTYAAWKKDQKTPTLDATLGCALQGKTTDEYSLDRVGELVAAAKREDLATDFVAYRVRNLGSADEGISWGLGRVYEAMPETVLKATAALKSKKDQSEVAGSVAFGLMNVHYKKKTVAQIKSDLKKAHPKLYKKPYAHHALANEVLSGIVEE